MLEQIGNELKACRVRNNLTLWDASKIVGVDNGTLSNYEKHPEILQLGMFIHILEKYNINSKIFFRNVWDNIPKEKIKKLYFFECNDCGKAWEDEVEYLDYYTSSCKYCGCGDVIITDEKGNLVEYEN